MNDLADSFLTTFHLKVLVKFSIVLVISLIFVVVFVFSYK